MQFSGHYLFSTSRENLWEALNSAEMLGAAIPGCRRIEWTSDRTLDVTLEVNLGVMTPVFSGDLVLSDLVPARAYTLTGKGRGRILGLASGEARVVLDDHDRGTTMRLQATGEASSAIMSLGRKLVGGAAQRVIDRFFERFAAAMQVDIEVLPASAHHPVTPA